ncbi:MAG: hypothetical protein KF716_00715 [Anaerolineae bacterium]|nr:hypothetical protein [Anaerolineae bacterium]
MKTPHKLIAFTLICSLVLLTQFALPHSAQAISSACSFYGAIGGPVTVAGDTNGNFGPFEAGETYTFTMTANAGSSITWRVVADPGGATTLAGPVVTTGTSTLTYTMPASGQPGGIGFYVDAVTGTGGSVATSCNAGGFAGRPIPSNFVLRTITCNVAVYDSAGGQPVGANAIKAGQTWYVNPTPVKDFSGKQWTEIYVSGTTNGFIPTQCVG